ncbi:hypothetical protein BFX80_04545 [Cobetia marina]|nr:hypothetical protein BFX80_04545 [Cobetia marina]
MIFFAEIQHFISHELYSFLFLPIRHVRASPMIKIYSIFEVRNSPTKNIVISLIVNLTKIGFGQIIIK